MNIVVRREKKSFLSTSLTTDSSLQFWKNLLGDARSSSASIPLHLRNPSLLNNHFLDTLPSSSYFFNSFTHPLSYSPHVSSIFNFVPITPNDLHNIFKRICLTFAGLLDFSGRMFLLCLPQYLDPLVYMINFSLSYSIFPSSSIVLSS